LTTSDYSRSRLLGLGTAAYAVFALTRPGHLARVLHAAPSERRSLDRLARTYGVRDLATSALLLSSNPTLVRTAMALRIASDVGDCAVLATSTDDAALQRKVAAATLGWAALNAAAWITDER
jgi:hypothetical protein